MKPVDLAQLPAVTAALAAGAGEYDRSGAFPHTGIQAVHEAGLLTATVGRQYGGPGLGVDGLTRILLALGRGDPSVALIASMTQLPHLFQALRPTWPATVYADVLAASESGPALLNTCRVEPDLGSPSRGGLPATVARRTANGWSLSGRKRFVTGAAGLRYFLVWAGTDEPAPRVGTFVVPADTLGIEVVPAWNQLGLRASGSHDVVFTDVPIPRDDVLDLVPADDPAKQDNLAGGALHLPLAAIYVGVARAAQDWFHRFAHERVPANLGRPIATTDRFKAAAGEIETLLSTAERLLLEATARFAAGTPPTGAEALAARVIANRHAVAAVTLATRLLGNPGLNRDNPLERHFRDVQSALVHAPQEDVALQAIGAAALTSATLENA
ncbi:acyl-CoA dehydrogenase family protein [Paractinoplanes toevensis]|uniref:Acyl-CoA dehydrogenase n=1 Tax=Paractinoplanes toevensis TaxID=571911 RepID=A0A919W6P1_9ACTN|nr:acyl-CoA dehydrogenase family protein [Actinoplanes toevensis]GIM95015.1 acyl-CoA dehydrogenase [Actinoplanes toevensis]